MTNDQTAVEELLAGMKESGVNINGGSSHCIWYWCIKDSQIWKMGIPKKSIDLLLFRECWGP